MYPNYYQNTNRGLSRPRPIYNVAPQGGNMPYTPGVPYYNSSYSYYQPIPRVYYY